MARVVSLPRPVEWLYEQTQFFGLFDGNVGSRPGISLPASMEDDVNAFLYYGTWGLGDPTNVADYGAWRSVGASRKFAVTAMMIRAFFGGGLIGWAFDPMDKREGYDLDFDMFSPPPTDYGVFSVS
jgi:hypothetical protein